MSDDVITRDENGDLAVRTVTATAAESTSQYDDLYARTTDRKRALRVVGGGDSGGGAVDSVNGKTGVVVLTGADIKATLTDGNASETATVTQHLQTLKNDDAEKGDAIQGIQELIPENASSTNHLATQADLPKGGTDNNGLEGDYATRYGIVDETTSGLPRMGAGNQVIIPAGLVLDVPGVSGLTTVGSQISHDLTATTNCEIWLANGTAIEVLDMFWSETEPEDGTEGFAGWWNGSEMKFKSNDTGNVWRPANAVRVAKCVFTDGNLTRLCFTGCRLLNKQEWLPLSGGNLMGKLSFDYSGGPYGTQNFIESTDYEGGTNFIGVGQGGQGFTFIISSRSELSRTQYNMSRGAFGPSAGSKCDLGTRLIRWETVRAFALSSSDLSGDDNRVLIPNVSGTMVVATPPTSEGTYILKATVSGDGTITTTWVAE